jgi:translation elongation factor EF-Tu-like GTPase
MPLKKKRKVVKKRVVKKRPAKRPQRKAKKKVVVAKKTKEKSIGVVTHYFPKVRAAVVKLKGPLSIGDTVKIKGHTTDFKQNVTSIQIDRVPITSAKKGQEIGLLVDSRVRTNDAVYKI